LDPQGVAFFNVHTPSTGTKKTQAQDVAIELELSEFQLFTLRLLFCSFSAVPSLLFKNVMSVLLLSAYPVGTFVQTRQHEAAAPSLSSGSDRGHDKIAKEKSPSPRKAKTNCNS